MNKNRLKIKVCGMRDPENIQELCNLPIDYLGHIFYAASSRYAGEVEPLTLPEGIKKTGVFVNSKYEAIMQEVDRIGLQVVQLHGNEPENLASKLKTNGIEVIKAFGIDDSFEWGSIEEYLASIDYLLFDRKSNLYGGTGQVFNWDLLKTYPFDKPYFLSGGLSIDNLSEALYFEDSRLVGLDLNSRFELSPGMKNIELIKEALKIIQDEQISRK